MATDQIPSYFSACVAQADMPCNAVEPQTHMAEHVPEEADCSQTGPQGEEEKKGGKGDTCIHMSVSMQYWYIGRGADSEAWPVARARERTGGRPPRSFTPQNH